MQERKFKYLVRKVKTLSAHAVQIRESLEKVASETSLTGDNEGESILFFLLSKRRESYIRPNFSLQYYKKRCNQPNTLIINPQCPEDGLSEGLRERSYNSLCLLYSYYACGIFVYNFLSYVVKSSWMVWQIVSCLLCSFQNVTLTDVIEK